MTQAWLMKPLLEKKSKSLEAMTTTMMKQIKTMKSQQKTKQIKTEQDPKQAQKTLFDAILLQDLANAVYNVMPTKLGDRNYWENFTKKTGNIARTLNSRLKDIFEKNPEIFHGFLDSLRGNIHSNIKEDEALDMITSHIITKPIFDAIFGTILKTLSLKRWIKW